MKLTDLINTAKNKKTNKSKSSEQQNDKTPSLPEKYEEKLELMKGIFSYPINEDFKIRELYIYSLEVHATILYLDNIVDKESIEQYMIRPLLQQCTPSSMDDDLNPDVIMSRLLTVLSGSPVNKVKDIVGKLVAGYTLLFTEKVLSGIVVDTAKFQSRSVEKPVDESVLRGPKEAFVESYPLTVPLYANKYEMNT